MRIVAVLLGLCLAAPALAGSPERDKAWDALIAEAQKHGGQETRLDKSVSYVFQREDKSYLAFTRLTGGDRRRSVCLISEGETSTACVDYDSGKLTLGERADAATPWRFQTFASLDAFKAHGGEPYDVVKSIFNFIQQYSRQDWMDGRWIFVRNK